MSISIQSFKTAFLAGLGSALAIAALGYLQTLESNLIWLMAPFGASAVLIFGVPNSPLAKPKNVIFGHVITAFIGLAFVQFYEVTPITIACATGLGVMLMLLTNTTHPPAGANPILIMMSLADWSFLFSPVLVGSCSLVVIGKLYFYLQQRGKF
ncbi:HPP family protein [Marinomonas epiphytica]